MNRLHGEPSLEHLAPAHLDMVKKPRIDVYFSADIETDGPIPGPYSMLSFALVLAGRFDGEKFVRPEASRPTFYAELRPISENYEPEALAINRLDRHQLLKRGESPETAMTRAAEWVRTHTKNNERPILVAYPLSFDWTFLYWYFVRFSNTSSPFNHSGCFDLKTAFATKAHLPIARAGRERLPPKLRASHHAHTHHALDDALEQAELFANIFEWNGND